MIQIESEIREKVREVDQSEHVKKLQEDLENLKT